MGRGNTVFPQILGYSVVSRSVEGGSPNWGIWGIYLLNRRRRQKKSTMMGENHNSAIQPHPAEKDNGAHPGTGVVP